MGILPSGRTRARDCVSATPVAVFTAMTGDRGIGSVDENLDAGGRAVLKVAGVVVGYANGDAGFAGAHGGVHVGFGLDIEADAKDVRGGEGLDEAAAVLGVGLVEDDGGDLADVGVYRIAEEEELEHGDEQGEEERAGVTQDVRELLAADGAETEEDAVHWGTPMMWRVRVTKMSSREAWMVRMASWGKAACRASMERVSTRAWMARPKMVASRTPGN
jgi:hypothetical protein